MFFCCHKGVRVVAKVRPNSATQFCDCDVVGVEGLGALESRLLARRERSGYAVTKPETPCGCCSLPSESFSDDPLFRFAEFDFDLPSVA